MADALTTRLELVTDGAAKAVADLNGVATASRRLGAEADAGGDKFAKLAKLGGKIGGAGKTEFLVLAGFMEAIEGAEKGWKNLASSIGQTALYAGAAFGIHQIVAASKDLSSQIDELYKQMDKPAPGFWGNLGQGWKIKLGLESEGPQSSQPITKQDAEAAKAAGLGKELQGFLSGWKAESSPEKMLAQWVEGNKESLARMGVHEREAAERSKFTELKAAEDAKKIRDQQGQEAAAFWKSLDKQIKEETATGKPGAATEFFKQVTEGKISDTAPDLDIAFKAFADKFKNSTGALQELAEKAKLAQLEGKSDLAAELVLAGKAAGATVAEQLASARGRVAAAGEGAERELKQRNIDRTNRLDDLLNPKFASGDTTRGSAAAQAIIARAESTGGDQQEIKRLAREQIEQVKQQTRLLDQLTRKALGIYSIN